MTTRARQALADCEHALADFEASANTPFQRPRWVAVMTLLRTVGLVLREVDSNAGTAATRRIIKAHWVKLNATEPEPRIFHEFIDEERNDVVHFYEPSAQVNITIQVGGVSTGGVSDPPGPKRFDFKMKKGPFKGRDPRELCREAITFWKGYLDEIDRDIGQGRVVADSELGGSDTRLMFGYPRPVRAFNKRHPLFAPAMDTARKLYGSIYGRRVEDMTAADQIVFLLARLAMEDYAEIMLLCGNASGRGGHKLLRGMFERVVTVFYLSAHPDETRDYVDYDVVSKRRDANTAERFYRAAAPDPATRAAMEARFSAVKDRYMVDDCETCHTRRLNFRWHKLGPIEMAEQVGLRSYIVPAYTWSTTQLHDTVGALKDRVIEPSETTITFDERLQPELADNVLMAAHGLLVNVLTKVVEHFNFTDAQPLLQQCHADYARVWKRDAADASPGPNDSPEEDKGERQQ